MVDLDFKSKNIEQENRPKESSSLNQENNHDFKISSEELTTKIQLISDNKNDFPGTNKSSNSNTNLAEQQIQKAQDRLIRLEKFNHELKDLDEKQLTHFENEPAYKRSGIELDDVEESSSNNPISRFTLDEDEFKENNSFLHDNVD